MIADLDGDGRSDLATANFDSATVSVLFGKSNGTIPHKLNLRTSGYPSFVEVADLDGDGALDLAVGSDSVSIFPGNGDGTFGPRTDYAVPMGASSLAIGDLNGDGWLDMVVGGFFEYISIFLGNGDGTFGPPSHIEANRSVLGTGSEQPTPLIIDGGRSQDPERSLKIASVGGVAVGDVSGDGLPDVAVGLYDFYYGSIQVLLGNGDGTLNFGPSIHGTGISRSVKMADLNGDGLLDMACGGGPVLVILNEGGGNFGAPLPYTVGGNPLDLAIHDLDGDGRLDITTADYTSSTASMLLGNGDGSFGPMKTVGTAEGSSSVAFGDLDGDGQLDLVTANAVSNTISVLLGDGAGGFGENTFATGTNPSSVVVGDFSGDGVADLAVTNKGTPEIPGLRVSILLANTAGLPPTQTDLSGVFLPSSVASNDLDGDGDLDLVVANDYSYWVTVFAGDGAGAFTTGAPVPSGLYTSSAAVDDLNGDGRPDLVVANENEGTVSRYLGNGDGTFGEAQDLATGTLPRSVTIADLNEDDWPDLVVATAGPGRVSVLMGNGDGAFDPGVDMGAGEGLAVAAEELTGDSFLDLAVATAAGAVVIMPGNGDGTFGVETLLQTGPAPHAIAAQDLDGNGWADLVVTDQLAHTVSVLLGMGNGAFQEKQDFGTGLGPSSVVIADMSGDGRPDLVVTNSLSNTVSLLIGTSGGLVGVEPRPSLSGRLRASVHPNPAFAQALIKLTIPRPGRARLRVIDVTGRVVVTLVNGDLAAGEHVVRWALDAAGGHVVSPGLYFYEFRAAGQRVTGKIVVPR